MLKIVALNEEVNSEDENSSEPQVTKEAEETIAESEYMRALTLQQKGLVDGALTLFTELLETRVLNEVSASDKNDRLFSVKYSCHKNVALIYEERGENDLALEHFIQAMELDDTDVYALNRLGQLALRLKKYNLAEHAFEKCLARNPNHWPSADGILQAYCHNENIIQAYGWALKWYRKNSKYERAIDVLTEIHEKFDHLIPFFKEVWNDSYVPNKKCKRRKIDSVFPTHEIIEKIEYMIKPEIDDLKADKLDWMSIGNFILSLYKYLEKTEQSIIFILNMDDIVRDQSREYKAVILDEFYRAQVVDQENTISADLKNIEKNQENDNIVFLAPSTDLSGAQTPHLSDSNAEDSDNPRVETESAKPKPRRRCSDLSSLEQWGWHKKRRYSSRKKSQQECPETDTTLNGFLKRIFAKYFEINFDNECPFRKHKKNTITKSDEVKEEERKETFRSYNHFQIATEHEFAQFVNDLQSKNFDLLRLIFVWLKYVSIFWNQSLSEEMKSAYHQIYIYYLNHYDLSIWNQLSNDEFNESYRMALLFMEIDYDKTIQNKNDIDIKKMNTHWTVLYHHLIFNSGFAYILADELYEKNMIRLLWLHHLGSHYENNLIESVDSLLHLEELLGEKSYTFTLSIPNLNENNYIDLTVVKCTRINLQRKISLSNVKKLYDEQRYEELIEILEDSLINSLDIKNSDNTLMKIQTQYEVLLESFWNLEKFEECLVWGEKCLKYAVDHFLASHSDTYTYKDWAESINFILLYIEELILQQGYDNLEWLGKYISRLVQSLSKIITNQLDTPFDKNSNSLHPINTKKPWVILHQILQRHEDNNPLHIKTRTINNMTEFEDVEDIVPHAILILFTAHEFLGRRHCCTKDNGQLLLYTLDLVAPKLRAPLMDAYRDYVIEYIEQITYCLYGYPPKKARSRHIEEHNAVPIDLTWSRAIQLFEIYKPETLPEYNSYKHISITADMEQLLLKILPLVPKEIDPYSHTLHIKDFISGVVDILPQGRELLPRGIACIYYLLADYNFKKKEFSKSIENCVLDLTCEPMRFDSWAYLALSKASKLETKLNSCVPLNVKEFLSKSEDVIRCFKQCIKLDRENGVLWIEYGSFAYIIHSFCSRNLKQSSEKLSMEKFAYIETRKEQYLNISYDCFTTVDKLIKSQNCDAGAEATDSHDEKWLHHYMLGKISEKRKDHPKVFLAHYLKAANYLYENNAIYPIKINHGTPWNLSVEALEVFYRTTSAIIKYLEQNNEITRDIGKLFNQVLQELSNSPFAYNRAKIDDNALKKKLAEKAENSANKQPKIEIIQGGHPSCTKVIDVSIENSSAIVQAEKTHIVPPMDVQLSNELKTIPTAVEAQSKLGSPSRRGSQESTLTTTTTTRTGTSSSTSSSSNSSSSSDSSSSDSESSSSDDETEKNGEKNAPFSLSELEPIYKSCILNLEECATRFAEHYKSVYRLVNHYFRAPEKLQDFEKCQQLLMTSYKTSVGSQITGLFADRKNNNFFNGFWRNPSSEIDRPGSFASHLSKCVVILMEVLKKRNDFQTLFDIARQLNLVPDNDRRYITEIERKELCQQAIALCVASLREILTKLRESNNNVGVLDFLLDVHKTQKDCFKYLHQKEDMFTSIMVDAYKFFIQDKVAKIPDNCNLYDLAKNLCIQELTLRRNQQKQQGTMVAATTNIGMPITPQPMAMAQPTDVPPPSIPKPPPIKPVQIPGISSRPRGRPLGSKNSNKNGNKAIELARSEMIRFASTDFMKQLEAAGSLQPCLAALANLQQMGIITTSPIAGTTNPFGKVPQFDIKNLIASAASQVAQSSNIAQPSATISVGSGQLTITPTNAKSSIPSTLVAKDDSVSTRLFQGLPKATGSVSVTKVPISSPGLTKKSIPDIPTSNTPPQMPNLPDLPKSLTITPAPSGSFDKAPKIVLPQSQQLQVTMIPEKAKATKASEEYTPKMKTAKKPTNVLPYAKNLPMQGQPQAKTSTGFPSNLSALNRAQHLPFLFGGTDMGNDQSQLWKTYMELYQAAMLIQQQPPKRKGRTPKNQVRFPPPTNQMINSETMAKLATLQPQLSAAGLGGKASAYIPSHKPLANSPISSPGLPSVSGLSSLAGLSSLSGLPSVSGLPSGLSSLAKIPPVSVFPSPSITPPNIVQSSPTKTLQQKLAEKQKACALIESTSSIPTNSGGSLSSKSKKKEPDVIILD